MKQWLIVLSGIILLLTACSEPVSVSSPAAPITHVASVDIDATVSQAELEAIYNASVILYRPEAGFAVLGFSEAAAQLTTLAKDVNKNAFSIPAAEVTAAGWNAWAGGWNAWAGELGASTDAAIANSNAWEQLRLQQAHVVSRKLGEGMTVAVIDTGIDFQHPMFAGRLAPSWQWRDFVDQDNYPQEVSGGSAYGHGTAVAGIILQVAPNAKILPIRVLDKNGKGNADSVLQAIDHAVAMGVDIINVSLGADGFIQSLYTVAAYANAQGIYLVASAGNNGKWGGVTSPARFTWYGATYGKTFGVGSLNPKGELSDFSARGAGLIMGTAPGEDIFTAYPNNGSARVRGTSFAAPMWSGALALALAETNNSWARANMDDYLWHSLDWSTGNQGFLETARLNVNALLRSLPGFTEPVYRITSVGSNRCLQVSGTNPQSNGANVEQGSCGNSTRQRWRLVPHGDSYQLQNVASGQTLEVGGSWLGDHGSVNQWFDYGGFNQRFVLRPVGDAFELVAKHSQKCLTVAGNSNTSGADVVQWTCWAAPHQQWKFQIIN
jgi:hypothetical protein